MMQTSHQRILCYQCKNLYYFIRLSYWIALASLLGLLGYAAWIGSLHPNSFSAEIVTISNTTLGAITINDSHTIVLHNILPEGLSQHLQLAYLIKTASTFLSVLFAAMALKLIAGILKHIVDEGIPYTPQTQRALYQIGLLVILYGLLKKALIPLVLALFKISSWDIQLVDPFTLFIGILIIVLSHIFAYGTVLQTEYDETL